MHTLNSKYLNKVFDPRFQITLTMLTQQGNQLQQGCETYIEWSSKRNVLKLRKLEFECDETEMMYFIQRLKSANNALEQILKPKK